jgi:hypothetical protein
MTIDFSHIIQFYDIPNDKAEKLNVILSQFVSTSEGQFVLNRIQQYYGQITLTTIDGQGSTSSIESSAAQFTEWR